MKQLNKCKKAIHFRRIASIEKIICPGWEKKLRLRIMFIISDKTPNIDRSGRQGFKRWNLCATIECSRAAKPRVNLSLAQTLGRPIEHLPEESLVILRQLRFPDQVSPRCAPESPIQPGQPAYVLRLQVGQYRGDAALRQIAETGRSRNGGKSIRTPGESNTHQGGGGGGANKRE